jgi:hypothetical protein
LAREKLGKALAEVSASSIAARQLLSVLFEPTPQDKRLTTQDTFNKVISCPNDLVFPFVLEEIPKIAQANLSEVRVGAEKAFSLSVMNYLCLKGIAHKVGNFPETQNVVSVIQCVELADVPVIWRQEKTTSHLSNFTWIDIRNESLRPDKPALASQPLLHPKEIIHEGRPDIEIGDRQVALVEYLFRNRVLNRKTQTMMAQRLGNPSAIGFWLDAEKSQDLDGSVSSF